MENWKSGWARVCLNTRSLTMLVALATAGLPVFQVQVASQTTPTQAKDPGVRGGAAGAGGPLPGMTRQEGDYFRVGQEDFAEVEAAAEGMGPRMNLDSCGGCHSQPAIGGTSPAVNPQIAFANLDGGTDSVPPFLSLNGPVREARFVRNPDGTPDGGVHALFTISGRIGAERCQLQQPDFAAHVAAGNVIFRIPTPTFGAGLIEMIPDWAILTNRDSAAAAKSALGIRGRANFAVAGRTISGQTNNNGNDGTIARFGWKAQNKSLLLFSGEAYNVEMGISNELFQVERDENATCQFASHPNDVTNVDGPLPTDTISAIEKFSFFMRFLAAPTSSPDTPGGKVSIDRGAEQFRSVGCAYCHTEMFKTGKSRIAALSNQDVKLFSDLLVHDMGVGLADGVSQGGANGREFRSAPLWGLGQRIFFLHDGRTSDLVTAIRAHASGFSEANGVIANYLKQTESQKQDLLNFLRSL